MLELLRRFGRTPGDLKGVNPFDALYGLVTLASVMLLGTWASLLERLGLGANKSWKRGEKLKVLFLAYSGARNTGAEARVAECIEQLNQLLGEEKVEINMTTINMAEAAEYFKGYRVKLRRMSVVFFRDVYRLILQNHVVVLVEGSCWKENFASALLLYFLYGAGLAARLGKPCFSYAVEAGKMNRLNNLLSWALSKDMTRIISRSEDSTKLLASIGLPGAITRVDTAWTVRPEAPEWADGTLSSLGWDGTRKLVGLAMQNYFWWPVVPDVGRWLKSKFTGKAQYQYRLIYFYDYGEKDRKAYARWAAMLAQTMDWMTETYGVQPVLVAMEALDHASCEDVKGMMKHDALIVSCRSWVGKQMAAMLRRLNLLITTRYHAMVLSMPGCVPFIGLSRDERIRGVMKEIGLYDQYYLDYRESDLEAKLRRMIGAHLESEEECNRVGQAIRESLPYYFAQLAMLGRDLREMVRACFPEFPLKTLDEDDFRELIPWAPAELESRVAAKYAELRGAQK